MEEHAEHERLRSYVLELVLISDLIFIVDVYSVLKFARFTFLFGLFGTYF